MLKALVKSSLCFTVLLAAVRCSVSGKAAESPLPAATVVAPSQVIFLPGIAGVRDAERGVVTHLQQQLIGSRVNVFDWTAGRQGLNALSDYDRNQSMAAMLSRRLLAAMRAAPATDIDLVAHSGGAAIAVWALEKMPAQACVRNIILLAPGLSPNYDLSRALTHVRGRMFVFFSNRDWWVSGAGTKLLGTMDRINTESAGYRGFHMPPHADTAQYAKLICVPYDPAWEALGNSGDHMGPLAPQFVSAVIVPLLNDGPTDKLEHTAH